MKNIIVFILLAILTVVSFSGCTTDAKVASRNLSKAADQFEIVRRIVFYNGITDNYILSIEGRCSIEFWPTKFEVTCKDSHNKFKKHYLGKADNVFPFVEQLDAANVSTNHYKVIFKPSAMIPDVDLR